MTTPELPHPDVVEAHQNAQYARVAMGFSYDAETGIMSLNDSGRLISGSPGEVLADKRFYIPGVRETDQLLNLAFEMGFLIGKETGVSNG